MSVDALVSRLASLTQRVDTLRSILNQSIGERTATQKRLKDEFSITSMKQAKARVEELDRMIEDETTRLESVLTSVDTAVTRIENDIR